MEQGIHALAAPALADRDRATGMGRLAVHDRQEVIWHQSTHRQWCRGLATMFDKINLQNNHSLAARPQPGSLRFLGLCRLTQECSAILSNK
jgi:hypothetical protein